VNFGRRWLQEWPLDSAGAYLNHGTVGVTPLRVMAAQQAPSSKTSSVIQPVHPPGAHRCLLWTAASRRPRLREAAAPSPRSWAPEARTSCSWTTPPREANAVLRLIAFQPGDEILVSDPS
jgi:isopenicillin-N epimerase